MAIFDYRCPVCAETTEVWLRFADQPEPVCRQCQVPLERCYTSRFYIWGTKVRP